jgi:hypothetical protein
MLEVILAVAFFGLLFGWTCYNVAFAIKSIQSKSKGARE